MLAVCGSAMRTGSVAMWQLMRALVLEAGKGKVPPLGSYDGTYDELSKWSRTDDWTVLKMHLPVEDLYKIPPDRSKVVVVVRDLRDVVVSLMNFNKWDFNTAFHARGVRGNVTALERWRDYCPPGHLLEFKYDFFIQHRLMVGKVLNEWLYLGLSDLVIDHKQRQWDINANKLRSKKTGLHPQDPEYMSRRHISSGASNQWKTALTPEQIKTVEKEYGWWLEVNGFEI